MKYLWFNKAASTDDFLGESPGFWNRTLLLKMLLWLSEFKNAILDGEFSQERISWGESWRWTKGSWILRAWICNPALLAHSSSAVGVPPKGNLQLWQRQAPKTMKDKQLTPATSHFLPKQFTCNNSGTLKCSPGPKLSPWPTSPIAQMDTLQSLRASIAFEWATQQKPSINVNKHCK